MRLWMLFLLFGLCIWGLFAKRGSTSGRIAGNIAVVGVVLLLLLFAALFGLGLLVRD